MRRYVLEETTLCAEPDQAEKGVWGSSDPILMLYDNLAQRVLLRRPFVTSAHLSSAERAHYQCAIMQRLWNLAHDLEAGGGRRERGFRRLQREKGAT